MTVGTGVVRAVSVLMLVGPPTSGGHLRAKAARQQIVVQQMLCNNNRESAMKARRSDISSKLVQLRVDIAALRAPAEHSSCTRHAVRPSTTSPNRSHSHTHLHRPNESAFLRSVDAYLVAMDARAHAHEVEYNSSEDAGAASCSACSAHGSNRTGSAAKPAAPDDARGSSPEQGRAGAVHRATAPNLSPMGQTRLKPRPRSRSQTLVRQVIVELQEKHTVSTVQPKPKPAVDDSARESDSKSPALAQTLLKAQANKAAPKEPETGTAGRLQSHSQSQPLPHSPSHQTAVQGVIPECDAEAALQLEQITCDVRGNPAAFPSMRGSHVHAPLTDTDTESESESDTDTTHADVCASGCTEASMDVGSDVRATMVPVADATPTARSAAQKTLPLAQSFMLPGMLRAPATMTLSPAQQQQLHAQACAGRFDRVKRALFGKAAHSTAHTRASAKPSAPSAAPALQRVHRHRLHGQSLLPQVVFLENGIPVAQL